MSGNEDVYSKSVHKRLEAQVGQKLFTQTELDAAIEQAVAGMREVCSQHIPWSDGKCTCGVQYMRVADSIDPFNAFRYHILQLPSTATDEGRRMIAEEAITNAMEKVRSYIRVKEQSLSAYKHIEIACLQHLHDILAADLQRTVPPEGDTGKELTMNTESDLKEKWKQGVMDGHTACLSEIRGAEHSGILTKGQIKELREVIGSRISEAYSQCAEHITSDNATALKNIAKTFRKWAADTGKEKL